MYQNWMCFFISTLDGKYVHKVIIKVKLYEVMLSLHKSMSFFFLVDKLEWVKIPVEM